MKPLAPLAAVLAVVLSGIPGGAGGATGGWFVVSFDGPIRSADRTALEAAGARALQYRHPNSYVAWTEDPAAARAIAAGVRALTPAEKIDATAGARTEPGPIATWLEAETVAAALPALRAIAPVAGVGVRSATGLIDVVLIGDAADSRALAIRPEVLHVGTAPARLIADDEQGTQIVAGNVAAGEPVPGYEAWLSSAGVDGSGSRVSIVDTGVDNHHPDLAGRVVQIISYGPVAEPPDSGGHGTHVAGIVAGEAVAVPAAGRLADGQGFLYGLGVAPRAELVAQNALDVLSPDLSSAQLHTYARDAVQAGSVAWNASWHTGEGAGVGYTASTATIDGLVRDADDQTPGAQPFVMVFSAGNAGPSPQTMTVPHEAKNIIAVASSQNGRVPNGSIDRISTFSSRGPAADGRIGPTVAAPGETVTSARSLFPGGSCNEPLPVTGLALYATCSGTSMAAPHVTGAVALVFDWWRGLHGTDPSPAMVKALLASTATDMGVADAPNGDEGWGRVDLGALFDPATAVLARDQVIALDEPGDESGFAVEAVDPSRPIGVMLVWTDPAGAPGANPALVNDLDLFVEAPGGVTYLGNNFAGGTSVPGGDPDGLNNVEAVQIESPAAGSHVVRVRAANLPGDGVPGAGDTTDQDFALVLTNATSV